MLSGGPNSAVDEITHVVPARATRTCSIPTRAPEMNSVNSAVPSKAWRRGRRLGLRRRADGLTALWRPGAQRYNDGATASAQDISATPSMPLPEQYRALREGAGLIDRSDRGRLLLTGADRRAYLQGLLTNDIAALTAGTGCYAAYLTAQGRMIADMRTFEIGGRAPGRSRRRRRAGGPRPLVAVHLQRGRHDRGSLRAHRAARHLRAARRARCSTPPSPPDACRGSRRRRRSCSSRCRCTATAAGHLGAAPVFVLRSDDAGVMGFDVVVTANGRRISRGC